MCVSNMTYVLRDKLLKGLQVRFLPELIPVSVSTETHARAGIDFGQVARQIVELVGLSFIFSTWLSRDRVTSE